ncbi:hypothetical protein ABTX80_32200 [Streptomyces erythrochromogenes]|uniref:hypothetical protein n=1 Tax=Streptomyces erythrochromogenes TaxID=285574 RepID=UPI00332DFE95
MIRTESPAQYQIHQMADRYEVRTREGRIRGEYLSLDAAEWAVGHSFAPVPAANGLGGAPALPHR